MKSLTYILLGLSIALIGCRKKDTALGGSETLTVTVKIPDSTGNGNLLPVKDAVVKLYVEGEENYEISKKTGEDGKCVFQHLNRGIYIIKTEHTRNEGLYIVNYKTEKRAAVVKNANNSTELILEEIPESRSGLLYIHTLAPNGTPLNEVKVCFFSTEQEFNATKSCTSGKISSGGTHPGITVFNGLLPGQTYYIKARKQTGSTVLLGELIFTYSDTGSAIHQYITLKPDPENKEGRLQLKFVNDQGIPQKPEGVCMLSSREEFLDTALNCTDTVTTFTGLIPGKKYYFKAKRESGSLKYIASDSVIFDPAIASNTMTFKLQSQQPPAGALTVQVFAPTGAPQPNATVCILYSRQELNDSADCSGQPTGPEGKVVIDQLAPNQLYYLKAQRTSGNVIYESKDSIIYQPGMEKEMHLKLK